MSRRAKFLSIDLGASSGRVMLGGFDGSTLNIAEIDRFQNIPVELNGTIYWNVLELYRLIECSLRKVGGSSDNDLISIGLDTWGNDFALLDKAGKFLNLPVHYRDNRTIGMMEKVFPFICREDIFCETGIQFMRFNALYQLYSMVYYGDPILHIADTFLLIPDLIAYFLTDAKVAEFTNATTTQMYNPKAGGWSTKILDKLQIPSDIFVDVVYPGTSIGQLSSKEYGFSGKVQVVAVAEHDTASAVAAIPAESENFVYISSGTWSLMGVEVEEPIINEATLKHNFTNEGGVFGTFRLLKNIMGLWIVQEYRRHLDSMGLKYSFAQLEDMAWKAKPFRCFIDPDDEMFAVPGDMPAKIKKYCEDTVQSVPTHEGEYVRCIMESLAFKYRYVLEHLEGITGKHYNVIHIVGGGVKNKMLCDFTAQATGVQVIAGPVEASSIGNLLMQAVASKEISDLRELREVVNNSFQTEIYESSEGNVWAEQYRRYRIHTSLP